MSQAIIKHISSISAQEFGLLAFSPIEAKKAVGSEFKLLGFKQEERTVKDTKTGEIVTKTVTKLAIEKDNGERIGLATNSASLADQANEIFQLFEDLVESGSIKFKLTTVKVTNGDMLKLDVVK